MLAKAAGGNPDKDTNVKLLKKVVKRKEGNKKKMGEEWKERVETGEKVCIMTVAHYLKSETILYSLDIKLTPKGCSNATKEEK
jgi:hypothetical protein